MEIYIDLLFIENIIINLFLLFITCQTVKKKINMFYMMIPASLGSIYMIVWLYFNNKVLNNIFFKLLVAFIMIFILFIKYKDLIFKAFIIFIMYSMCLAGICLFLEMKKYNIIYDEIYFENFPYKKLILSMMIIYIFVCRGIIFIKDRMLVNKLIYTVYIQTEGNNKQKIKAFLDTGNQIREPVSNLPVIIVEKDTLKYKIKENEKLYISYNTISGFGGTLEAFKPQNVYVCINDTIKKKEAVVALCSKKLSKNSDYNALFSAALIN